MHIDTTTVRHEEERPRRCPSVAAALAGLLAQRRELVELCGDDSYMTEMLVWIEHRDAAEGLLALLGRARDSQDEARRCADIAHETAAVLASRYARSAILVAIAEYERLCVELWNGWDVPPGEVERALRIAIKEVRNDARAAQHAADVIEADFFRPAPAPRAVFRCVRRAPARRPRARRSHRVVRAVAKPASTGDPDGEPPSPDGRTRSGGIYSRLRAPRGAA